MAFDLMIFSGSIQKHAVSEILQCNETIAQYGLALTEQQAAQLVETRSFSLKSTGRIEIGGGIIDKLILEFSDSPYIFQENYTEILQDLIEIFYLYKGETLDLVSDDALIRYMKQRFDHKCHGSLELLKSLELEAFARRIRFGIKPELILRNECIEDDDEEGEKEDDNE